MTDEIWLPVVGFEGVYEVSSLGRIKRSARGKGTRAEHVLAPGGYPYLHVALSVSNKTKQVRVHIAVAAAFLGPSNGLQVNHKNAVKTDNRVVNLEYVSRSGNTRHALEMGLIRRHGEHNSQSRLTFEQVGEIRSLLGTKTNPELASMFGVAKNTISQIRHGIRWRDRQRMPDVKEL